MVGRWLAATTLVVLAGPGCTQSSSLEDELYIAELEQRVAELDTQLNTAWQDVSGMSASLTSRLRALELSVDELNLRVMDLQLQAGDPQFAIREVEAAVAVVQQRLAEVKSTSVELARYVE